MKKVYSEWQWKNHSHTRSVSELHSRRGRGSAPTVVSRRPRTFYKCKLPRKLSFVDNPEGMLELYDDLKAAAVRHELIVFDFAAVETMTSDAIAFLLAAMKTSPLAHTRKAGNLPADPKLLQKLADTGFFNYVKTIKEVPSSTNSIGMGSVGSAKDAKSLTEVVIWALVKCYGDESMIDPNVSDRLNLAIGECMINTVEWANILKLYRGELVRKTVPQTWIINAHYDADTGRTCITFLDFGIGILASIVRKRGSSMLDALRLQNQGDILDRALEGEFGSRTGQTARGEGLPKAYQCISNKFVDRLVLVSNSGYTDVNRSTRTMGKSFRGTLFYFELESRKSA